MAIHNVTDINEFNKLVGTDTLTVVDFWAPWCGPCQNILPLMDKLDEEFSNVEVIKVNIDENKEIPAEHGVRGIPTVILFKTGKVVDRKVGAFSLEDYSSWVKKNN